MIFPRIPISTSPQVLSTLIIGVAVIVTSAIVTQTRTATTTTDGRQEKQLPVSDIRDTDSDGVEDWEEQLYGTDSTKKDTDDDGVSDKDEIAEKKSKNAETTEAPADVQPTTKTEMLAGDLIGTFINRTELGVYQPKDNDKIIGNALDRTKKLVYTKYTLDSIKKSTRDTSTERVTRYRDDTKKAIEAMSTIPEYELQTYARAVDKNDPAEFGKLGEYAKLYAGVAEKLLTVEVPDDVLAQHITLANALSYLSASLNGMSKGFDDVAGSYAAVGHFGKAEQEVELAFQSFQTYFLIKKVENL
ncbi:MAG: hypothetical protein WAX38_03785 [Minisyncoccia bacterium]